MTPDQLKTIARKVDCIRPVIDGNFLASTLLDDTLALVAEVERLQSALTWTTERPTVPGWYWRRYPNHEYPIVCLVTPIHGEVFCDSEAIQTYAGCLWSGPIPEPQERPDDPQ